MKVGVVSFPGSNCDLDTVHILSKVMNLNVDLLWHASADLEGYDVIILPGGFSYGDHLRAGVIAAYSPVMKQLKKMAEEGRPILGICNGFQILVESGLLPGALARNSCLRFICRWMCIRVDNTKTAFTRECAEGEFLHLPIAHNEGRYYIEEDELEDLFLHNQIVFIYVDEEGSASDSANPNGSIANIAGVCNRRGNVVGLMPHPERASEKILSPFHSNDGLKIFRSMLNYLNVDRYGEWH